MLWQSQLLDQNEALTSHLFRAICNAKYSLNFHGLVVVNT